MMANFYATQWDWLISAKNKINANKYGGPFESEVGLYVHYCEKTSRDTRPDDLIRKYRLDHNIETAQLIDVFCKVHACSVEYYEVKGIEWALCPKEEFISGVDSGRTFAVRVVS